MTRTIPWLKEQPAAKYQNSRSSASKTQRLPPSLSESDEDERIALRALAKRRHEAARKAGELSFTGPEISYLPKDSEDVPPPHLLPQNPQL